MRANRLQAVATPGTEAEARLDLGVALRTAGGARLAQEDYYSLGGGFIVRARLPLTSPAHAS